VNPAQARTSVVLRTAGSNVSGTWLNFIVHLAGSPSYKAPKAIAGQSFPDFVRSVLAGGIDRIGVDQPEAAWVCHLEHDPAAITEAIAFFEGSKSCGVEKELNLKSRKESKEYQHPRSRRGPGQQEDVYQTQFGVDEALHEDEIAEHIVDEYLVRDEGHD